MWDLRIPAGLFFSGLGIILLAVGLLFPENHAPLTQANVNLYCGIVMLAFGGVMLWLSKRRHS